MASEKPIKISSGKRKRFVGGTDFIAENIGGTGEVTYARGDLLVGDASNALTKLTLGSSGKVLTSDGTDAVWSTPTQATELVSMTNDNAGSLSPGMAVYATASAHCDKAKADSATTSKVLGLATATIASAAAGNIQVSGSVSLTTGQWDTVTGGSGGLTYGTTYYLSAATAGLLTSTAPDTTGQELFKIGVAMSTTVLALQFDGPDTL